MANFDIVNPPRLVCSMCGLHVCPQLLSRHRRSAQSEQFKQFSSLTFLGGGQIVPHFVNSPPPQPRPVLKVINFDASLEAVVSEADKVVETEIYFVTSPTLRQPSD